MEFEPVYYGIQKFYRMKSRERRRYACFDGLSFHDYVQRLKEQLIKTEPPVIRETYRLDRQYRYGIGLHIIAEAEEVNRSTVERAIARFYDIGETNWESAAPVARNHLPLGTEEAAFAALKSEEKVL